MQLALGTVQFGLDYGVANTDGKMDTTTMTSILQQAWAKGDHSARPGSPAARHPQTLAG